MSESHSCQWCGHDTEDCRTVADVAAEVNKLGSDFDQGLNEMDGMRIEFDALSQRVQTMARCICDLERLIAFHLPESQLPSRYDCRQCGARRSVEYLSKDGQPCLWRCKVCGSERCD